ncbi:MAG: MerR family transcriptional regulator [Erysipelotrichaceae bacterium]|nr:MerR family transcriptional regulator [Erysipelotrichaceae bacterium]
MKKLSIGQMAKMNNTTVQALRLYDNMGLLKPIEVNDESGYRYYDVKQCAQLDLIHYMKSTGMTLKEIKQVFDEEDFNLLNKVLHKHLSDIDQQIQDLKVQKKAVRRMMSSYDRYLKSPQDGTITLEYISERKIYPSKLNINIYDYDLETYESILKELKSEMVKYGVDEYYYFNAGTTITKNDFINRDIVSNEIFVFVDQDCTSQYLQILPSNMYICMYCDGFDNEKEYIYQLYDEINKRNYQVIGDYICEVLTEFMVSSSNKRAMYLRLQVPVSFVKN